MQKKEILARHKFYLAFENANIKDYVTEKFWDSFRAETVPIYMGAPNINDFIPARHSIIRTTDFKGPKELAAYLTLLNDSDTLYNEYLSWRDPSLFKKEFKELLKLQKYDTRCRVCLAHTGNYVLRNGDLITETKKDFPSTTEIINKTSANIIDFTTFKAN